jgi:hypothetical protein
MAKTSMMYVSQEAFDRVIEYKMIEGWTLKTKTERLAILEKELGLWPYSMLMTAVIVMAAIFLYFYFF